MSAISVSDPSDEGALTTSHCVGERVEVEAYLTTFDGVAYLTGVERVRPKVLETGPCWPREADAADE